ncbi:MAG TPA: hypothetical protein VEJ63_05835 [Planctomycetota bacterium]|nr:hypothetical protein [Planctomycetota bacterium]
MRYTLIFHILMCLALLPGCGGGSAARVQSIEDAESFCKARGVELTGKQEGQTAIMRAAVYKVGKVSIAMTQFKSNKDAATWKSNFEKMAGREIDGVVCGSVGMLITGGTADERQRIVKALE